MNYMESKTYYSMFDKTLAIWIFVNHSKKLFLNKFTYNLMPQGASFKIIHFFVNPYIVPYQLSQYFVVHYVYVIMHAHFFSLKLSLLSSNNASLIFTHTNILLTLLNI